MTRKISRAWFLAYLLGWSLLAPQQLLATTPTPNIIVILADDLGYGDLSSFGATDIQTPNIDKLAANGLKFTNFYAGAAVCTPSRAAFLTGRQASRMGIEHVFMHDAPDGMPLAEITIAEQLKPAGYTSALVGKWHLGHLDRYMPWNQGFDEFYGVPFSNDMPNLFFYENQKILYEPVDQRYLTQRYTQKSLDFIERNADKPFFLYLAHSMPHVPVYASPEFEGTSSAGIYGDAVQEIDWSTGQIVEKLRALGILDNTLIIFTSDNGPWLTMGSHAGSAGPLRDGKGSAFEGGQRVPTVMQWPAGIAQPGVVDSVASLLDLMPTFSALAGVTLPSDRPIDGHDISPLLESPTRSAETKFYYHGMQSDQLGAVRDGDWKLKPSRRGYPRLIEPLLKLERYAHGTLLFNLAEDPGEEHNLADDYPELVARMRDDIATKQAQIDSDRERALFLSATAADRKGYGQLFARLAAVAFSALLIVLFTIYWLYRGARRVMARTDHKENKSGG